MYINHIHKKKQKNKKNKQTKQNKGLCRITSSKDFRVNLILKPYQFHQQMDILMSLSPHVLSLHAPQGWHPAYYFTATRVVYLFTLDKTHLPKISAR